MLDRTAFDNYKPGADAWANDVPDISLYDLKLKYKGKPKVSMMISTYNRRAQLARTLECLARQDFRAFELLFMDDGSTQNMDLVLDMFEPFLQIKRYHAERSSWRSCPSKAYRTMLPDAQGEVIAITMPEEMLDQRAMGVMYRNLFLPMPESRVYMIPDNPEIPPEQWAVTEPFWFRWMSLRPGWIPDSLYPEIDKVDWHKDARNLQKMPGYNTTGPCFAGQLNPWHATYPVYPWWCCSAALRACPIWDALPEFKDHGIIDRWFYHYRQMHKIVDVVPNEILCYHQPHQTSAVGTGEKVEPYL